MACEPGLSEVRPRWPRRTEPMLLPGALVVAFLLATGRWGSYLGVPSRNIFVTDVALVAGSLWWTVVHGHRFRRLALRPLAPVLGLLGWAVVRFAVGGDYDLVALRDLAPYVYALVALAACWTLVPQKMTLAALEVALVLHLLWLNVAMQASDWAARLPMLDGRVRVLEARHDFDSAVLAVLVCVALLHAADLGLGVARRVVALLIGVLACYTILQLGSRAGVLALAATLPILAVARLHMLRRVKLVHLAAMAALIVSVGLVVLPQTYLFDRITEGQESSDSATGTFVARQEAWALVLDDAADKPGRLVFGSGFGPDFLDRSGGAIWFEVGTEKGVRAPHNFLLNTLARLGIIGVLFFGWILIALARATVRLRDLKPDRASSAGLLDVAVLTVVALLTASLVGVILESPFGAVPFWWAAGLLLVRTRRTALTALTTGDGHATERTISA